MLDGGKLAIEGKFPALDYTCRVQRKVYSSAIWVTKLIQIILKVNFNEQAIESIFFRACKTFKYVLQVKYRNREFITLRQTWNTNFINKYVEMKLQVFCIYMRGGGSID